MLAYILTRPDKSVLVVYPAPQYTGDALARTLEANPEWKDYPVTVALTAADLPKSRRFRNAWRLKDGACSVDMPAARDLWLEEVRAARAPKLAKSDVDAMRALEKGDATLQAKVATYRQHLRDITATERPRVDACTTPEALDALEPEWPLY